MPKYLSLPIGRVCRLEAGVTPEEFIGLYTDDISACNAIVIYSGDKDKVQRASMFHMDSPHYYENLAKEYHELISQELKWVGDKASVTIIRRASSPFFAEAYYPDLKNGRLKVHMLPEGQYAITFDRSAKVATFPREDLPEIATHPEECLLDCHYKLNFVFSYLASVPMEYSRLLYDGSSWQELAKHDKSLIPKAQDYWKAFNRYRRNSPIKSVSVVLDVFNAKYVKDIGFAQGSDPTTMFVWCFNAIRMIYGHDYKAFLLDEARIFMPKDMIKLLEGCLEKDELDKVKRLMLLNIEKGHPVIMTKGGMGKLFIENLFKYVMRMKQHQFKPITKEAAAGAGAPSMEDEVKAPESHGVASHVFKVASSSSSASAELKP